MPKLDLSTKDQAVLVGWTKEYVVNEFENEVGRFEAEGMLEFFAGQSAVTSTISGSTTRKR